MSEEPLFIPCSTCSYVAATGAEPVCWVCKLLDRDGISAKQVDQWADTCYPEHPRLDLCCGCGEYAADYERDNPGKKWRRIRDDDVALTCSICHEEHESDSYEERVEAQEREERSKTGRTLSEWAGIATAWHESSEGFLSIEQVVRETLVEYEKARVAHERSDMAIDPDKIYGTEVTGAADRKGWS